MKILDALPIYRDDSIIICPRRSDPGLEESDHRLAELSRYRSTVSGNLGYRALPQPLCCETALGSLAAGCNETNRYR
jgi:hypothetical protein